MEEFEEFCNNTQYLEKKGIEAESLTIDRIINTRGYEADNIQSMTKSDNSRKGCYDMDETPF